METKLETKEKHDYRKTSVCEVWELLWSLQWTKLSYVTRALDIGVVWRYHMARINPFTGIYQGPIPAQSTCSAWASSLQTDTLCYYGHLSWHVEYLEGKKK